MTTTIKRATVLVSDRIQATGKVLSRNADGTVTILHEGKSGRKSRVTGRAVWESGNPGQDVWAKQWGDVN